ncbi:hypothetical protein WA026_013601 [Henosepilachna vigintioctopunctata]
MFIKKEVEFGSEDKQNITDISIFNEDNIWGNLNDSVHQYVDTGIPCNEVSLELVKKEHDETIEEHEVFIKEDPSIEFHSCKREIKPITKVFSDNGNQVSEYLALKPRNESAKCIKKKDLKRSRMLNIDEKGSINDGAKQSLHEMNNQLRHKQDVEEQKLADFVLNNQELKCETDDSQTSCIERVFSEQKSFKCLICDYEAIDILDYTEHAKEVHFSFKCKLCPFKSYIKTLLGYHYNSVHSKLRNYKCQYCDYAAKLKSTLKKHIAAIHLQNLTYKCDLCDYAPKRRSDLKRHVEAVHLKFKSFHGKKVSNVTHKCDLCDYGSSRRADLKRHVDAVHLNCKNFKCESRSFSSNHKLKSHKNTVHSMKKNV